MSFFGAGSIVLICLLLLQQHEMHEKLATQMATRLRKMMIIVSSSIFIVMTFSVFLLVFSTVVDWLNYVVLKLTRLIFSFGSMHFPPVKMVPSWHLSQLCSYVLKKVPSLHLSHISVPVHDSQSVGQAVHFSSISSAK